MNPAVTIDAVWPGLPYPRGATWDGMGVNFALFTEVAERVELCLFDASGRHEVRRIQLRERTDQLTAIQDELAAQAPRGRGRFDYKHIVGQGRAMRAVFTLLDKYVDADDTVLVTGDSGTGKELVARALHAHGRRAAKPFVSENCAALPESLLESELFGHVRGAFTGAQADKKGLFEAADGVRREFVRLLGSLGLERPRMSQLRERLALDKSVASRMARAIRAADAGAALRREAQERRKFAARRGGRGRHFVTVRHRACRAARARSRRGPRAC